VLRGFLEVRPPRVKINPRPSGVRVGVIRADQLLEFRFGSPTTESGDQGSDRKRGVIDDEGVRGRSPEPAGGRQRRVLQAAEPLLRRLEGVRVRPRRGLRQDTLEAPRAQAAGLLPPAHAPVRGLQGVGGHAAGRVRGRAGASLLALLRHPEDGAPPDGRPAADVPRRAFADTRRGPAYRRLLVEDEQHRILHHIRGPVRIRDRDQGSGHAFYQAASGVWLADHVPPG